MGNRRESQTSNRNICYCQQREKIKQDQKRKGSPHKDTKRIHKLVNMLDDSKYNQMVQKFPHGVKVELNKKLFVTRTWFRNFYMVGVFGAFAYYLFKQPQVFAPYSGYPTTIAYKAQPDYFNNSVIFSSQERQNTLSNF